jgi:glycosyltransferase involved in cell wall biosynthesis
MRVDHTNSSPVLSVVIPVDNEEENIAALHRRLTEALTKEGISFERVLVNDGSKDATPGLLDALATEDRRVVAVHFSRNFGHQPAVSAGRRHARGRAVVVMDGDLQDPYEVLGQFVAKWLFHSLVHAELRYNFPVLPMLFLLAAASTRWAWRDPSPELAPVAFAVH